MKNDDADIFYAMPHCVRNRPEQKERSKDEAEMLEEELTHSALQFCLERALKMFCKLKLCNKNVFSYDQRAFRV